METAHDSTRSLIHSKWSPSASLFGDPCETIRRSSLQPPASVQRIFRNGNRRGALPQSRVRLTDRRTDYVLGEVIGRGGMGLVFSARQIALEREVAVKLMRPKYRGNTQAQMFFIAEALIMAELGHPNILQVFDIGITYEDDPFYSMTLVRGSSWRDQIGRLHLLKNLRVLRRVADAVSFAHSRGVIHRDLKPANVMIGDHGEVLVMDWGLAASVHGGKAPPVTDDTVCAGTPAYMPPEVARGDVANVGAASDIYLLGGLLYHIVTGRPPHVGKTAADCLEAAALNRIETPEEENELLDIALQALASDPADRPSSAAEFQELVREYVSHFQSISLSSQARKLRLELPHVAAERSYRHCEKTIALYTQSLGLWPENKAARVGLSATRHALAEIALRRGDIHLARDQVRAANRDRPGPDDAG